VKLRLKTEISKKYSCPPQEFYSCPPQETPGGGRSRRLLGGAGVSNIHCIRKSEYLFI